MMDIKRLSAHTGSGSSQYISLGRLSTVDKWRTSRGKRNANGRVARDLYGMLLES
jgi:hypothetical protein